MQGQNSASAPNPVNSVSTTPAQLQELGTGALGSDWVLSTEDDI